MLEIKNNETTNNRVHQVLFNGRYDKQEINNIKKYLNENDVVGLIDYIADMGVSAKEISDILRGELKNTKKFGF